MRKNIHYGIRSWIRGALLGAIVVFFVSSACDLVYTPSTEAEKKSGPYQPIQVLPEISACRYTNPFSHSDECKEYAGSGWSETSAATNCGSEAIDSINLVGDFSKEPCSETGVIGNCIVGINSAEEVVISIYSGEASVAKDACENFVHGVWSGSDEEILPIGELMPQALEALQSDDQVTVSPFCGDYECVKQMAVTKAYFLFKPAGIEPHVGLVLYPGGRVDPRAYAPIARAIALEGYLVAIVPMPNLMAYSGFDRGDIVKADFPSIDYWFVGGHSLGGTNAGRYAFETGGLAGLVIWASYISSVHDLSHTDLPVITIYGSEEDMASEPMFEDAKAYLPATAEYEEIEGGTHAQFGNYGNPKNETPGIDRNMQQSIIVQKTDAFMQAAMVKAEIGTARYAQAAMLDQDLCEFTQRALTNMDTSLLPADQLDTQWYDSPSEFAGAKATIDASFSPPLTIHGFIEPHPEAGRWAPESLALEVRCKMRRQDRIEAALSIDLAGPEGTCRQINEEIFAWALAQLGEQELSRYELEGVKLLFADDIVANSGGNWLPQRPVLTAGADNEECSITAPALDIPFPGGMGEPQDLVGVHYCKLISYSQALYWATVQGFQDDACSLPETSICPNPNYEPVSSCIFYFSVAGMHFCEEYSGPGWTMSSSQDVCSGRSGDFAPLSCAEREEETSVLDGDGEFKGTCVVICDEENQIQRTWNSYSDPVGDISIEDYCLEYIPAEG